MENELDIMLSAKMGNNKDNKEKPKTERRRSSIFSLLKMKKLSRQFSEPSQFSNLNLKRKFSIDSAILTDYKKERDVSPILTDDNQEQDVNHVFDETDTVRINGG